MSCCPETQLCSLPLQGTVTLQSWGVIAARADLVELASIWLAWTPEQ